MLKDFVSSVFEKNLGFTPTHSQKKTFECIAEFICSPANKLFLLKGYAGTGKTSTISALVQSFKQLKLKTILLAPTGRAAKVLSIYSNYKATTIHKKIYRLKSLGASTDNFLIDKNLHTNTIFIVDEASMISDSSLENNIFGSGRLLNDIIEYVESGKNCRLIIVGDEAQLPPVGLNQSPALNIDSLRYYYNDEIAQASLTDIVRQSILSGILHNATIIRNLISNNISTMPKLKTENFPDIIRLNGAELIESISDSYNSVGIDNTIIITRSNKRANKFNEGIRRTILWMEDEISINDQIMVVKNNYFGLDEYEEIDFIANGDIAKISRIGKYQNIYNFRFVDVSLYFDDYNIEIDTKIILDTLSSETPALSSDENKKLYYSISEDYADLKTKKERYEKIKKDPFFNALQVKFGYAITCHKAQGGQWEHVYVDHGYLPEETLDIETLRWLYTAFTRARKKLFLVNFKKEFFEDSENE